MTPLHHHPNHPHDPALRTRVASRVTWVSIVVNIVLAALQVLVGFIGHSQALIADGMHSLSDLFSDFLVLFANRHSARDADSAHPYGHARIETATTMGLGLILMGMGSLLIWSAAQRLQNIDTLPPVHVMTLWIALLTLFSKEGLFQYMRHIARKLNSRMLEANAWHARGDAASSLVVVAGIAGNLAGITSLDLLAAVIVAAMIFRMGWKQARDALMELIDTGLDAHEVAAIRQTLTDTPGVLDLHELRTRRMGDHALVDAHIRVNPRISVSEGHHIAEHARMRVIEAHNALDVLIHIDPEEDPRTPENIVALPERTQLEAQLLTGLHLLPDQVTRIDLHYLENRVEADVLLSWHTATQGLVLLAEQMQVQSRIFSQIRLHQDMH